MMDLLTFMFQDGWHFFGVILFIIVLAIAVGHIIEMFSLIFRKTPK